MSRPEPARPRRPRRTWPQRLVVGLNSLLVLACLGGAAAVWFGNDQLGRLERVSIVHATLPTTTAAPTTAPRGTLAVPGAQDLPTTALPDDDGAPLDAENYLIVGTDARDCIDPASPYAGAFLAGPTGGERPDTIMVLRIDPDESQAAIVSFPRDLWVRIAGTNRSDRINTALRPEDPSRLVQTIELNFGIRVDHYVAIDFCAFKGIVDTVGGVRVPFDHPTRDKNTGLNVTQPGCYTFTGDAALAYVRSRHYEWFDGKRWRDDPSGDFGRIRRQQDFIKRSLQKAVDRGARNPAVVKNLLDAAWENVTVDTELTVKDLYQVATRLRSFDPSTVRTYFIDGRGVWKGSKLVVTPNTTSQSAKEALAIFRGEAPIGGGPAAGAGQGTTEGDGGDGAATATGASATVASGGGATTTSAPPAATTTTTTNNGLSIVPPDDPTCR